MTLMPDNAIKAELRGKWGWFLALGIILLAFGVIAAANILTATVATVFWIGFLMIAAGVVEIIHAFSVKTWGSTILSILAGIVYAIAGWIALSNPVAAAGALTLFLGIALIVAGLIRVVLGFAARPLAGWGWVAVGGAVTAAAGLIVVSGWPQNSAWILGLFLACDLIVQGVTWILLALGLKKV